MKLYSFQHPDVVKHLAESGIYFAEYAHKKSFSKENEHILIAYKWLMSKLNEKINNDFSSCPIWWYTTVEQARENLHHVKNQVLLIAEVPEKLLLLYHSDLWYGPLNSCGLGRNWYNDGFPVNSTERYWDLLRRNLNAKYETWNEIFHYRKSDKKSLHAVTPYIDWNWLIEE